MTKVDQNSGEKNDFKCQETIEHSEQKLDVSSMIGRDFSKGPYGSFLKQSPGESNDSMLGKRRRDPSESISESLTKKRFKRQKHSPYEFKTERNSWTALHWRLKANLGMNRWGLEEMNPIFAIKDEIEYLSYHEQ